jgi:hypothetical protein
MTDRQRQVAQLEKIFNDGARSPFFKRNAKHPMPQDAVPRIAYSDIMDKCAPVVATYDSTEALVDDGWIVD